MKPRKIPMRRCVGCMESKPKKELVRIVADQEGQVRLDLSGKAPGRGVYLCQGSPECFRIAKKKRALSRGLEVEIPEQQMNRLAEELNVP